MCEQIQSKPKRKELIKQIEDLEGKLKSKTEESGQWYKARNDALDEIEQLHQMLDGFGQDVCPREVDDNREYCSGKVRLTLSARLLRYVQSLVNR